MSEHDQPPRVDPPVFRLLMACRWPLALVLSAWAIAVAAIQILRQPIPIALPLDQPLPVRLDGPLKIDSIAEPVKVDSNGALTVQGKVRVDQAVQVKAASPLPVQSSAPLAVAGEVAVKEIEKPISVSGIAKQIEVDVNNDEPLQVQGNVAVEQVGGRVNVTLKNAIKSISPIPLP